MTAQRGWVDGAGAQPPVANVPNVITGVRTVAAIGLAVAAIVAESAVLLAAAIICYWVGDILDGLVARLLRQETRIGAVFDLVADRACCAICVAGLLVLVPEMALPLGLFLLQFMVLDCLLSLAFLHWPILSPNYFGLIHRGVYRWNWSPPAKALNSSALIGLVLLAPSPIYPTVLALGMVAVKVVSLVAVVQLTRRVSPVPVG